MTEYEKSLQDALDFSEEHGQAGAARALGIARSTLRSRLLKARDSGMKPATESQGVVEFPDFPSDDLPVEEIIESMCERYAKRKASYDAHTWFDIKVNDDMPIGVLWIGDPHTDDSGCNWPALREHVGICAETDGMYGAMLGDLTNNWVGRLVAKYADQETSKKTAYRLAEWLMMESGVDYLLFLVGNHDAWNDGIEILKRMMAKRIVCHDWEARFKLVFKNGREVKVHAAHDFRGHSMWNNMHGPLKASRFKEEADLFVCGDKHNWGIFQTEHADRGNYCPTLIRVRGYKFMDEYGLKLGFPEQQLGCSILTIIDPNAKDDSAFIQPFTDISQGAEYLSYLREKN